MSRTTRSSPMDCPFCGRPNDAHTDITGTATPKTGDPGVCWKCGGLGIFEITPLVSRMRRPTPEERAELLADPEVATALATWKDYSRMGMPTIGPQDLARIAKGRMH